MELPFAISPMAEKKCEEAGKTKRSIAGLKILVVEDNELNMEIAEFMLSSEGAQITKMWNGQEAVQAFIESAENAYDVILMDLMMPIMGGLTATRKIRGLERKDAKTIPIIAMTAKAFSDDIEHCRACGMNAHLAKPIDAELMFRTIAECVDERKNGDKNVGFL